MANLKSVDAIFLGIKNGHPPTTKDTQIRMNCEESQSNKLYHIIQQCSTSLQSCNSADQSQIYILDVLRHTVADVLL